MTNYKTFPMKVWTAL